MAENFTIKPTFEIPPEYERTFILEYNGHRHKIKSCKGRIWIYMGESGEADEIADVIKWVQGVLLRIRDECLDLRDLIK